MKEKTVEVNIVGENIILKTDDVAYVEKLSRELGDKINNLSVRGASKLRAAILISLDLLDENKRMKALINDLNKTND